jgi:hypothetical protein
MSDPAGGAIQVKLAEELKPRARAPAPKVVETRVIPEQQIVRLEAAAKRLEKAREGHRLSDMGCASAAVREMQGPSASGAQVFAKAPAVGGFACGPVLAPQGRGGEPEVRGRRGRARAGRLAPFAAIQQRILNALLFLEPMNGPVSSRAQIAFMAGTTPSSSHFQNSVSALKTGGLLSYPSDGLLRLTEAGRSLASRDGVPSCTEELQAAVIGRLPSLQQKILRALLALYPEKASRAQISAVCGTSEASSHFQNNVSALKTLGVLEYPESGWLIASSKLLLEAHR